MPPDRDAETIADMIAACRRVGRLIEGFDRNQFLGDERTQGAVIHQVLLLGEATKRLSVELQTAHAEIPWALIARTRDLLIHHYEIVDLHEVWKIAADDIPRLLTQLESVAR